MAVRSSDSSTGNREWASSRVNVRSGMVDTSILAHTAHQQGGFVTAICLGMDREKSPYLYLCEAVALGELPAESTRHPGCNPSSGRQHPSAAVIARTAKPRRNRCRFVRDLVDERAALPEKCNRARAGSHR